MDLKHNLIVFGTRPEEIKLYPFTKYKGFEFLQVDQSPNLHQGLIASQYACDEESLEATIKDIKPDRVIVQGDTRTAFRAAIYAFEQKIPIVHIEAGLRTWDFNQPFPEEFYRQAIDLIASYKFCSTYQAAKNCGGIYVGQTGIDTLFEFLPDCQEEDFYIVTVHRNESWERLPQIIATLKKMRVELKIFAHPNRVGQELKKHFETFAPLEYREFVKLLARAKGCVSDSGGLQEECIALGKEFISLREKSERGLGESYTKGATEKIVRLLNE